MSNRFEKFFASLVVIAFIFFGVLASNRQPAHAAALPQINTVQSTLTLGYHEVWSLDLAGIAKVPQCSKAVGCSGAIQLCNLPTVQGGGCITLAGNGASTFLNVSVSDTNQPAGSTTPVETSFPIGTVRVLDIPGAMTNSVP